MASPPIVPEPMAPAPYTPPAPDKFQTLLDAQTNARGRVKKAIETPQAQAKQTKAVKPAFRTQDAALGLLPALLLLLAGKQKEAGQFGMGYLGGKQQKASQDTELAQARANEEAWAANEARNRELGSAQFEMSQAGSDIELERERMFRESQAGDKARGDAIRQAIGFHRAATDEGTESAYRVNAIDQAISLLSPFAGDPAVGGMLAQFEALRPSALKPSMRNNLDDVRLQKERKALGFMDQDLRDKHLMSQERIRTMRASQAMAASMGDMKWFQTYTGLFDEAIKDVDDQLKRMMELSKITPFTEEQMATQVQPLIDYKNDLVNQKSAIPMPGKPSAVTQQGAMDIAGEGGAPPFEGKIFLPPGPIGNGRQGLPAPRGGVNSAPIVTEGAMAKKKSADEKEANRKASEKAENTRKESERKAKDAERSGTRKEIEKAIRDLETEKAGLDEKADKEDLKKINAELATRRKQLDDLTPAKAEGTGIPGPAGAMIGVARATMDAAKKTSAASKAKPKAKAKAKVDVSDHRKRALAAIAKGAPKDQVRKTYEKETGKKADF